MGFRDLGFGNKKQQEAGIPGFMNLAPVLFSLILTMDKKCGYYVQEEKLEALAKAIQDFLK